MQTVTDSYGTYYYIDSDSIRDVLTWEQMKTNALYFYTYALANFPEWSLNAVSAMLGNIRYEGVMNPSQWQYGLGKSESGGYGLVQWTPATKFLTWASAKGYSRTEMSGQIQKIGWEAATGEQWIITSKYPVTFTDFLKSEQPPDYLASVWLYNYERPKRPGDTESYRREMALTWYQYLSGEPPNPPEPPEPPKPGTKKNGMPVYMYPAFRGRR